MNQKLDATIQELDTVVLVHDIPEHHLKQGEKGAVVHCYSDGAAFEVEFVDTEGYTTALLTLTHADIDKPNDTHSTHDRTHSSFHTMSDTPKVQMNFQAPVYGVAGNVEGDQVIHVPSQNAEVLLADFKQFLNDLQQKYPNATDETAMQVVDAEFTEMKRSQPRRWRNLLNLKRQWNGVRTALLKAGEHYTEETPLGKALIGYLEGISEDLE